MDRRNFLGGISAFVAGMIWDPYLKLWVPSKAISIPQVTLAKHKLYSTAQTITGEASSIQRPIISSIWTRTTPSVSLDGD